MTTRLGIAAAITASLALAGRDGMQPGASSYDTRAASAGSDFRYGAREVVAGLQPVCPYTVEDDRLAQYDPVRARMEALEERIAGTALEVDLAVVRSDYAHFWQVNTAECGEPDGETVAEQIAAEIAKIVAGLDRMEAAAGVI